MVIKFRRAGNSTLLFEIVFDKNYTMKIQLQEVVLLLCLLLLDLNSSYQEYWIVDPEEKKQRNLPPPESNLHLSRQEVLGRRSRLAHIAGVYSVLSRPASGVENNKSPLGRGGALATGWVMLIKYTTNSYSKHDVYTTETHESVGVGIFKKLFPIPKKHLSSPHTRQVPVPLSASFL